MARSYNFIYTQLVKSPDDVEGHVAYSLYKADKVEFIQRFKAENNNQEPTEEDLEPFHKVSCLPSSLDRYRLMANNILGNMMEETLKSIIDEVELESKNNHMSMLEEVVKPLKPKGFGYQMFIGTLQSIVGTLVFAILLACVGFVNLFKLNDIIVRYKNITTEESVNMDKKEHPTENSFVIPIDTVSNKE